MRGVLVGLVVALLSMSAGPVLAAEPEVRAWVAAGPRTVDLARPGEEPGPDGVPDACFKVWLGPGAGPVKDLEFRAVTGGFSVWDTTPGNGMWALVQRPAAGGDVGGGRTVEVFVADDGSVAGGVSTFQVTLTFGDGSVVTRSVDARDVGVGGGGAPLAGGGGTERVVGAAKLRGSLSLDSIMADARVVEMGAASEMAQTAGRSAAAEGVVPGAQALQVDGRPEREDGWLGGAVAITLPLTQEQLALAHEGNVGGLYLSPLGPFFIPGELDRAAGTVTFPTEHFSWFTSATQRAEAEVSAFITAKAHKGADALATAAGERLKHAVDDYVGQVLPPGLDESVKMKILRQVWERREEIGAVAAAGGKDDAGEAAKATATLVGKVIVDGLDEGSFKAVFDGFVGKMDVVAASPEALKKARAGDYWAAVEVLGRAYSESTPLYTTVKGAADEVQKRIDDWKKHEWETAYAAYTKGAPASFMGIRKAVQPGDWEQIMRSYGGIADHVMKKYGVSDPAAAAQKAREMFDRRRANEEIALKEQERLKRWYEFFDGRHGWSYRDDFVARAGLEGRSKREQFEAFLKRMETVERDLRALGKAGGAMYWTNLAEGRWGVDPDARALLNAFMLGGGMGYQAKLAEIRAGLAGKLPVGEEPTAAAVEPAPSPAVGAEGRSNGARYAVTLGGDWGDTFEARLFAGVFEGSFEKAGLGENPAGPARIQWRGDYSRVTKTVSGTVSVRYPAADEAATIPADQSGDGFGISSTVKGPMAEISFGPVWREAEGRFEGSFSSEGGAGFRGRWSVSGAGVGAGGTWTARISR